MAATPPKNLGDYIDYVSNITITTCTCPKTITITNAAYGTLGIVADIHLAESKKTHKEVLKENKEHFNKFGKKKYERNY